MIYNLLLFHPEKRREEKRREEILIADKLN
jgi:hypothetical protein